MAILKNSILGSKLALSFERSSDILPKGLILLFHLGRTYLFSLCSRSSGSPLPALYSIFLISMVCNFLNYFLDFAPDFRIEQKPSIYSDSVVASVLFGRRLNAGGTASLA